MLVCESTWDTRINAYYVNIVVICTHVLKVTINRIVSDSKINYTIKTLLLAGVTATISYFCNSLLR